MKKVKSILCILMVLAMMLTLFACSQEKPASDNTDATSPGGTAAPSPAQSSGGDELVSLVLGVSGYLGIFLPGVSPSENRHACSAVFDSVFYYDYEKEEFYSNILADWHFEDQLTLVMTLKSGVLFSNGDEATPEDLLFSYTSNHERGSAWFNMIPVDWENCVVRDDGSVQIKLLAAYQPLLEQPVYLINKKWSQGVGWDSQEWYKPVGSGPYACSDYLADDHITLTLRDDYWNTDNTNFVVDEWVIKYYPDPTSMEMDFEQGNIDLTRLSLQGYDNFLTEGGEGIDVLLKDMGVISQFFVDNNANPALNDIAVRKAIAHACDWEQLGIQRIGESMYRPVTTFAMPDTKFNNPNVKMYEYDPELSEKTLEEAGYAPGQIVINVYAMQVDGYKNFFDAMQYYLDQVGIVLNVEYGDVSSALAKWVVEGGTQAGVLENGNGSLTRDPFANLDRFTLGFLFTYWHDDAVQAQIAEALYCPDPEKQLQLYLELEQYMHDNYICFPICVLTYTVGYKTEVFDASDIEKYVYQENYYNLMMLSQMAK
jgi:peptide/nickel transport system substrate-binding protein